MPSSPDCLTLSAPTADLTPELLRSNSMEITSLTDHVKTTTGTAITTEWGLSLHLKRNNVSMLFDMASSGRPTSVQFKGRINGDKARKRHQTRHLEFYTPQLLTEGLQVRVLPGVLPMKNALARASGATLEARFFCSRLLPPRQIAKLLEGNKMTGAGDGNRTHVRSLGLSVPFCFARNNKIGAFYLSTHLLADGAPFNKALLFGAPASDDLAIPRGAG